MEKKGKGGGEEKPGITQPPLLTVYNYGGKGGGGGKAEKGGKRKRKPFKIKTQKKKKKKGIRNARLHQGKEKKKKIKSLSSPLKAAPFVA